MSAVSVRVTGRVQGVAFRESCRREATRLGVAGWVRNEPDGSVAVHAEGDDAAVEALVDWCRSGPAYARVAGLTVTARAPEGLSGFRVD